METFDQFVDTLIDLSTQYGTGSLQQDILLVVLMLMACIATMFIVVALIRWLTGGSGKKQMGLENELRRFDSFGGKLHKLEKELSDLRTEIYRNLTFLKERMGEIETDINTAFDSIPKSPSGAYSRPPEAQTSVKPERPVKKMPVRETDSGPVLPPSYEKNRNEDIESTSAIVRGSSAFNTALEKPMEKSRTSLWKQLGSIFARSNSGGGSKALGEILEDVEATLIASDLGVKTTEKVISELKEQLSKQSLNAEEQMALMREILQETLEGLFGSSRKGLLDDVVRHKPAIVLIVGVNGAGKTTTTAKLGKFFRDRGLDVLLVAADTFRAAAVAQLRTWAERLGVDVFYGLESAKPSTVVFDAIEAALKEKRELVLIDTAGRLHTRDNLMLELEGVVNILKKKVPTAPHEVLLVIDGTAGQNALKQAAEFHSRIPLTGVIVTKLDGTSKGGIVAAIEAELAVPVCFVGVGEGESDLQIFDKRSFVTALLEDGTKTDASYSAHAEQRKRRKTKLDLAEEED